MRTNKKTIEAKIASLERQGFDIAIGWMGGRPRVTNKSESRDLSPRLTNAEMIIWIDGFDTGVGLQADKDGVRETADLIDNALHAACKTIQDGIGQTDGGMASHFFTGENRETFTRLMRAYIKFEDTI